MRKPLVLSPRFRISRSRVDGAGAQAGSFPQLQTQLIRRQTCGSLPILCCPGIVVWNIVSLIVLYADVRNYTVQQGTLARLVYRDMRLLVPLMHGDCIFQCVHEKASRLYGLLSEAILIDVV